MAERLDDLIEAFLGYFGSQSPSLKRVLLCEFLTYAGDARTLKDVFDFPRRPEDTLIESVAARFQGPPTTRVGALVMACAILDHIFDLPYIKRSTIAKQAAQSGEITEEEARQISIDAERYSWDERQRERAKKEWRTLRHSMLSEEIMVGIESWRWGDTF